VEKVRPPDEALRSPADITVLDDDLRVVRTFVRGEEVDVPSRTSELL
jgi:hypothetical protein